MMLSIIALTGGLTYLGIFAGTFVEGPAVGFLAGFLVKAGILNLYLAYIVHVFGDMIADLFYYFVGSRGQRTIFKKFNISKKNLAKAEQIKKAFHKHPKKIIILGKLTCVVGLPILLGIGMSHYDWRKFLFFNFLATIAKSAILIYLGYYLADFWTKANDFISYLSWFGLLFIIIISMYFIMKKLIKNL